MYCSKIRMEISDEQCAEHQKSTVQPRECRMCPDGAKVRKKSEVALVEPGPVKEIENEEPLKAPSGSGFAEYGADVEASKDQSPQGEALQSSVPVEAPSGLVNRCCKCKFECAREEAHLHFHRNEANKKQGGYKSICKPCSAKISHDKWVVQRAKMEEQRKVKRRSAGSAHAKNADVDRKAEGVLVLHPEGSARVEEAPTVMKSYKNEDLHPRRVSRQDEQGATAALPRSAAPEGSNEGRIHPPRLLTIDLTDYPEIYDEIKRYSREQERTPEGQVRYWLRTEAESLMYL